MPPLQKIRKTNLANYREQMDREYAEFQKLDPSTPEPIKQRRQQEVQALYQKMEQFQNDSF